MVLSLDGAVEGSHMGHADFRAHGRIFATLRHDQAAFGVVMLTPEQQQELIARSPGFTPESGAWGRAGCTRVRLEMVDRDVVGEALTLAWQNAAAKAASRNKPRTARKRVVRR